MKSELREAVEYFAETKVWPDGMISLKSRYKFFIVAMQTEGQDILQTLTDSIDNQMTHYSDADYSDILEDLHTARQAYEGQLEFAADRKREGAERSAEDSLLRFESQDNNIDRAFQFIFKLVEAHPEVPSLKVWNQSMLVIKGVGGRIIKQKKLSSKN